MYLCSTGYQLLSPICCKGSSFGDINAITTAKVHAAGLRGLACGPAACMNHKLIHRYLSGVIWWSPAARVSPVGSKHWCSLCNVTGDPLHSRALAHSRAPLFTQPCPHCSHSRAPGEQWARLCVFTLQGCVQAARLCRGSPVNVFVLPKRQTIILSRYTDMCLARSDCQKHNLLNVGEDRRPSPPTPGVQPPTPANFFSIFWGPPAQNSEFQSIFGQKPPYPTPQPRDPRPPSAPT